MRGLVRLADVRLDFDDPPGDAAELGVVGYEPGAEQPAGRREGRPTEDLPVERPGRAQVRG